MEIEAYSVLAHIKYREYESLACFEWEPSAKMYMRTQKNRCD